MSSTFLSLCSRGMHSGTRSKRSLQDELLQSDSSTEDEEEEVSERRQVIMLTFIYLIIIFLESLKTQ